MHAGSGREGFTTTTFRGHVAAKPARAAPQNTLRVGDRATQWPGTLTRCSGFYPDFVRIVAGVGHGAVSQRRHRLAAIALRRGDAFPSPERSRVGIAWPLPTRIAWPLPTRYAMRLIIQCALYMDEVLK